MNGSGLPLATADQLHIETRALALLRRQDVQAACRRVAEHWVGAINPNAEHRERFDTEFEQAALCGVMNALNADPARPRIHSFGRFAHDLDGQRIPATKSGHPNPDYVYRFMPLAGGTSYIIRGQAPVIRPTAIEIGMLTSAQFYQQTLSKRDLVTDPDGSFTITIDPEPAAGRVNHFQSNDETHQLLIRDIIGNLSIERPLSLEVEKVTSQSRPSADDDDSIAATCEKHLRKHVDDLINVHEQLIMKYEPNHFEIPKIHGEGVYSATQAYCAVNFRLEDEEAFLLTLDLGNAAYAVVPVSDFWGGLGPVLDRQVTMGTGRAKPNSDGRFTFVVAHSDPGVHNWIDPCGLHEGVMFLRWVGFDPDSRRIPALTSSHVRFADLPTQIPVDCPRLDPAGRAEELAVRRSDYLGVMG